MFRKNFERVVKTNLDYAVELFKQVYPYLFDTNLWLNKTLFAKENLYLLVPHEKDYYGYYKSILLSKDKFYELLSDKDVRIEFYLMKKLGYSMYEIIEFLLYYKQIPAGRKRGITMRFYEKLREMFKKITPDTNIEEFYDEKNLFFVGARKRRKKAIKVEER